MNSIRHTYLLSYLCEDDEKVYEFTAYSYQQATLIANRFCETHNAQFLGLELTCISAAS